MAVTFLLAVAGCVDIGPSDRSTTSPQYQGTTATSEGVTPSTGTTTTAPNHDDWLAPETCEPCPAETVATIPLGSEGITYKNLGVDEAEPVGPASVVVSDSGSFYVLDSGGLGVVAVRHEESTRIRLDWPGIRTLIDLALSPDGLQILDIDVSNLARVADTSLDGDVRDLLELPAGLQLEKGLSGVATGPAGEMWVELEGGAHVAVLEPGATSFEVFDGYPYPSGVYGPRPEQPFAESLPFQAGDAELVIEAQPGNWLGAKLLGINPDMSFVLEVAETSQDADGVLRVSSTAHWYSIDGAPLGLVRLPLEEQIVYVSEPAVVGPDGYVYYLITRLDDVAILRLPWGPPA